MPQNLMSVHFSADSLTELDQAIATLEKFIQPLLALDAEDVKGLSKMGEKSEQFCRQALMVLEQNRDILPPTFDLTEMQADMTAYEALRPRALRLREALARIEDTQIALGSDVMVAALGGYQLMKMFGKAEGLATLQTSMAALRPGRKPKKPATT